MKYGEVVHFSHPYHTLRFEYTDVPFRCDGCKEAGIGSRFKCTFCDYDLHKHCALPSPSSTLLYHPFYPKCAFRFLARPPGDIPRYCNACQKDVAGFVYHCGKCGFDLHPCCANLPHVIDAGDGLTLQLQRKVRSPCHRCGRKGRSWSYRSSCRKYNLHVACVTEMLVDSWHDIYFGNNNNNNAGGGNGHTHGTNCKRPTAAPYYVSREVLRSVPSGLGVSVGAGGVGYNKIVPAIRGTRQTRHRSKGKVKQCCEMAAMAVQFIISAVLGDPTTMIAGIVGTLIAR